MHLGNLDLLVYFELQILRVELLIDAFVVLLEEELVQVITARFHFFINKNECKKDPKQADHIKADSAEASHRF